MKKGKIKEAKAFIKRRLKKYKYFKEMGTLLTIPLFYYFLIYLSKYSPIPSPKIFTSFDKGVGETILNSIIGGASTILGIIIVLLTFWIQSLQANYDDFAFKIVARNKHLRFTLILFFLSIIVPFLTLIQINNDKLTFLDFDRIYFSLFLFISSIILAIIFVPKIIRSVSIVHFAEYLIKNLTPEIFINFIKSHRKDSIDFISDKKNSPINELSRLKVILARKDNEEIFEHISELKLNKLKKILLDSSLHLRDNYHPENIIKVYFNYFFLPVTDRLIISNNERLINIMLSEAKDIVGCSIQCNEFSASTSINGYLLNKYVYKFIDQKLERNFWFLFELYQTIINEVLCHYEDKKINTINDSANSNLADDNIWNQHELTLIVDRIDNILEYLIEKNNKHYIDFIIHLYQSTILNISIAHATGLSNTGVIGYDFKLTELHQAQIIYKLLNSLKVGFTLSVEKNVYLLSHIRKFFPVTIMSNPLYQKKEFSSYPIQNYLESIEILSLKYPIDKSLFVNDPLTSELRESIETLFREFDKYKDDLLLILSLLEKIFLNVKKRKSSKEKVEKSVLLSQANMIRNIYTKSNINDDKINIEIKKLRKIFS